MGTGGRTAGIAALAATLLCAASANAQIVTLGPSEIPSAPPKTGFVCRLGCSAPYTIAQRSSSYLEVVPASGVITNWRVNAETGPLALRVLEPAGGGRWVGAGTSSAATRLGGEPNPTELPIAGGDTIGVDLGENAFLGAENVESLDEEVLFWEPLLGEGESREPNQSSPTRVALFDAEVELTPVVSSVSSSSGSTAGGDTVTITGKYLDSAVNVVFGSHPATTFGVDVSGERITATTPASAAGTVDVHVSNLHSTSETVAADRYTFVAPGGPSSPSGGGGSGFGAAPSVSGFTESATRWRRGGALPHISSAPVGTTFAFDLNEPASLALSFMRVLPGRRAGGRCVAPGRGNRTRPRCKHTVAAGALPVAGHAGLNKIRFQGRLSRTSKLAPGNYSVEVTTRGGGGTKALTRPLTFTIVP